MSFLDDPEFRLEHPDAAELVRVLSLVYYKTSQIEPLLDDAGLPKERLPLEGVAAADLWPRACALAAAEGKLRRLVEIVRADAQAAAHRAALADFLAGPAPADDDPFAAHLVGPGSRRAFLDRRDLRDHLRDLANDVERVLVVTGPRWSGKTYTRHLIQHLADLRGFTPHYVDCREWTGPPAGPREVMTLLALSLGWEPPDTDTTAQEETVGRFLVAWFNGRMRQEPRTHWVMFDHLDAGTLSPAGLRLVQDLAAAAHLRQAGTLRVVLSAFGGALPHDVDPYVLRDELPLFDLAELHRFFAKLSAATGCEAPSAEEVDAIIAEALGDAGAPPPVDRVSRLIASVGRLGADMLAGRGAGSG